MIYAKPSTSLLVVFRAYLASDHVTPATGKTIAITISKNGGAFGNPNAGATNATELSSGFYKVTLDTTDTNTSGPLAVRGAVATVDDVGVLYYVGQAPADVTHFGGTAATTSGGRPEVNTTHAAGTAWGSGAITAGSIAADAITAAKIATGAIDADAIADNAIDAGALAADCITSAKIAAGAIDAATFAADTGFIIRANTCQAGSTGTTIVLDAGASATNNLYSGLWVVTTGGTGAGQVRLITAYTGATQTATVATWITTPDNTTTFAILPAYTVLGVQGNVTGNVSGSVGSVTGAVGSVTGAVGSVTGNVGGNVTGSVGSVATGGIAAASFAAGAIDAAAIATGAIDADALAADAGTEIGTAVWASATRTLTANTNFNDPTAAAVASAVVGETITELSAIPAASPTLKQALALLYMALRNKVTVTSTNKTLFNDAGTALGAKALSDDGTTYTEAEIV